MQELKSFLFFSRILLTSHHQRLYQPKKKFSHKNNRTWYRIRLWGTAIELTLVSSGESHEPHWLPTSKSGLCWPQCPTVSRGSSNCLNHGTLAVYLNICPACGCWALDIARSGIIHDLRIIEWIYTNCGIFIVTFLWKKGELNDFFPHSYHIKYTNHDSWPLLQSSLEMK